MSYEHLRRSSRIPKELSILLTGSDMDGKGFSEMTKTVLLSRHGAGIISTYKLSAEQEIIVRYLDTNKEALVRVVGRIGSEGEIYTYGVAFVDTSNIDFWGIDFAPISETEKRARRVLLECSNCKQRETVDHSDVESDVLIINDSITRFCKQCGDSTLWRRTSELPSKPAEEQPVLVAAGQSTTVSSSAEITIPATKQVSVTSLDSPSAQTPSAYASPMDRKPAAPLDNRRKHPRTKVNYKACIRRSGFAEDIVTCEDMSKGGLCFKSRKQYFARTDIEVAVPYSPGGNAIFVTAEIAWVVEITKDKLYKCGVTYRRASRAS
ncbi:MAG: PilZ domain-containing protein [Candidatus Acidiferrum sp.]